MLENVETATIIQKKLLPALEELARAEFGPYSMTGNIDEETVEWMGVKGEEIITVAKQYMTGLMKAHIRTGTQIRESEPRSNHVAGAGRREKTVHVRVCIEENKVLETRMFALDEEQAQRLERVLDLLSDEA